MVDIPDDLIRPMADAAFFVAVYYNIMNGKVNFVRSVPVKNSKFSKNSVGVELEAEHPDGTMKLHLVAVDLDSKKIMLIY